MAVSRGRPWPLEGLRAGKHEVGMTPARPQGFKVRRGAAAIDPARDPRARSQPCTSRFSARLPRSKPSPAAPASARSPDCDESMGEDVGESARASPECDYPMALPTSLRYIGNEAAG